MANPFSIEPANPLQALMTGSQAYGEARKRTQEDELRQGRLDAVAMLQQGGDIRNPLAKLIGIGDVQGAQAIASYAHQQAQEKFQQQQLGESSRHNRATEGIATEGLNKPQVVPAGSELVTRQGQKLYGDAGNAKLDEPTIDAMARQLMAGDTTVLTNLGRGAQGAENVVAVRKRVAQLNASQGETGAEQAMRNVEYGGAKAGARTVGVKGANIELAATEFKQVLPVVMEASKAVNRTNYPDLNKIIQAYNEKTGDPNIVKFGGGVNTLVNLYARAISPTGVSTVSDKDHARLILNRAWSQGQFDAAVSMMTQEIDAALASPEKVRDEMRRRFMSGQPGAAPQAPASAPAAQPSSNIPAPPPGFKLVQ